MSVGYEYERLPVPVTQPGCAGGVRITAGVVADTERCVTAMEDILCAEP